MNQGLGRTQLDTDQNNGGKCMNMWHLIQISKAIKLGCSKVIEKKSSWWLSHPTEKYAQVKLDYFPKDHKDQGKKLVYKKRL